MTGQQDRIETKSRALWIRMFLWLVAFLLMGVLVIYQRRTGPTYPVRVNENIGGSTVTGKLPRSHPGEGGALVSLEALGGEVSGELVWRRYPTQDAWERLPLVREGDQLQAELPHQSPAGKLEYSVRLEGGEPQVQLPHGEAAVIRFRGDVPPGALVPHIIFMFVGLLVALRAGLAAITMEARPDRLAPWALGFLVPGGLIFGPVVQKYAFGEYWTGWPFGTDWTDNKTAAGILSWVLALIIARWVPALRRVAVLVAVLATLAVYLIPHSIHGSELDWEAMEPPATAPATPGNGGR